MTPEQFVVWLKGEIDKHRSPEMSTAQLANVLDDTMLIDDILDQLPTVVLKNQPPQPGVPGVLGQGLMKLEKADPTAVPVFNGGGCQ